MKSPGDKGATRRPTANVKCPTVQFAIMNLEQGEKVGRYEVVSFIGAGGMGQVYRARDAQLARDVALKLLPTTIAGRADIVARFHQEARSLGLLNHPNLVTVFDFGTHGDSFYIVLEM